jgi:hypothetical protein
MKKFTLFFLSLFFVFGSVIAQNAEKKWAIGLGPGIDYNLNTKKAGVLGDLYFSRYLSPRFDLMLDSRMSFQKSGVDVFNPLLNLRLKLFNEENAIQPYLFGGVGYLWDNTKAGVNFDGGAGLKFPVSPNTSLYVAGSYVNGIKGVRSVGPVTDNHFMVTSILEFAIGAAKDSDGDGVKDKKDKCPGLLRE